MNFNLYEGKRVFLTGHTGFKGSWMLAWLHQLGAKVKGYALATQHNNDHYNIINGNTLCDSLIADIRDRDRLEEELLSFAPDFIFHLAAQPLVRLSYEIPAETFDVNVMGTANVLQTVKALKKPCVVVCITTDKVYENREWHYPYRENDALGGYDAYSASKAAAELVIASFRQSFFNPADYHTHHKSIASARAGNVIGGGDWSKDRIVPDIISALNDKQTIQVRNPHAVRPWQHVLEPIAGYLTLGARMYSHPDRYAQAWNFGPLAEDTLQVINLVKMAIKIYGSGNYETPELKDQPHEAGLLKLDINKAMQELGWKPVWSAQKAVDETIRWYTGEKDTFSQIVEYRNDMKF
jgi:CDP-glucose 4,6-dehydratase